MYADVKTRPTKYRRRYINGCNQCSIYFSWGARNRMPGPDYFHPLSKYHTCMPGMHLVIETTKPQLAPYHSTTSRTVMSVPKTYVPANRDVYLSQLGPYPFEQLQQMAPPKMAHICKHSPNLGIAPHPEQISPRKRLGSEACRHTRHKIPRTCHKYRMKQNLSVEWQAYTA